MRGIKQYLNDKKLKKIYKTHVVVWDRTASEDLSMYGIDVEAELTRMLTNEINRGILETIMNLPEIRSNENN